MNTKSKLIKKLKSSREYRDAFVASQISIGLPFQLRAIRKQQELDQAQLAAEAGMLQPRISAMESPGQTSPNLETLRRLASALNVGLIVRFAPFSELLRWSDTFSPDDFQVPTFDEEFGEDAPPIAENVFSLATGAPLRITVKGQAFAKAVTAQSGLSTQPTLLGGQSDTGHMSSIVGTNAGYKLVGNHGR